MSAGYREPQHRATLSHVVRDPDEKDPNWLTEIVAGIGSWPARIRSAKQHTAGHFNAMKDRAVAWKRTAKASTWVAFGVAIVTVVRFGYAVVAHQYAGTIALTGAFPIMALFVLSIYANKRGYMGRHARATF